MRRFLFLIMALLPGFALAEAKEIDAGLFNSTRAHTRYRVRCEYKSEVVSQKKTATSSDVRTSSQSFSSTSYEPIAVNLDDVCNECQARAKGTCQLVHNGCEVDEVSRWNKTIKEWETESGEWRVRFRNIDLSCPAAGENRLGKLATVILEQAKLDADTDIPPSPRPFYGPELPPYYRPYPLSPWQSFWEPWPQRPTPLVPVPLLPRGATSTTTETTTQGSYRKVGP